jgi:hypothetical protein
MDSIVVPTMQGYTRKELRETVGIALGDLMVITATADSPGPTTFTDTNRLVDEPRYYNGREVYFVYGTAENQGLIRHVQSSSQAERTLTFTSALPANVQVGDQAHMVNWRGVGFSIYDYHSVIDAIHRDMAESHYEMPVIIEIGASLDAATNRISLPESIVSVEGLEYYDDYHGWTEVYPHENGPLGGWSVDPFLNAIQLSPAFARRPQHGTLRLMARADPTPPQNDGDMIYLPHEWMSLEAQARLLEQSLARNPGIGERNRMFVQLRQRADNIRPLGFTRSSPFAVRVR